MSKKSKAFLPKKIAGVKVPKKLRKGRVGELLASETGQALIAEALVVASAIADAKTAADDPKAREALTHLFDRVRSLGDGDGGQVSEASSAMTYALGEAARSFAEALRRGKPEEPSWEAADVDPQAQKSPSGAMEPQPL